MVEVVKRMLLVSATKDNKKISKEEKRILIDNLFSENKIIYSKARRRGYSTKDEQNRYIEIRMQLKRLKAI